ncbi:MAG: A24 family peptidase C-terminal domain-containing protein [Candidatus ainarchaeum sp.]|nr:A24 family peptidase C-terminal domain-containing protein [Candidatus ainarchaeum sp.]
MDYIYLPIIVFSIVILLYITYQDIKYREINIMSLFFLALFSVIYLALFVFKTDFILWKSYLLQLAVSFIFLLIFYVLGKISYFTYIGEGDLYTIFAISFTNIFDVYFPMFVFFFALILTLLIPICLFFYNLFSRNFPKYSFFKSMYLMFLGVPLALKKINKFYTPLEKFKIENNKLISNIVFMPNIEPEIEIKKIKLIAKTNNISKIWFSPLIPFIILILISYIFLILLYVFNIIPKIISFFI